MELFSVRSPLPLSLSSKFNLTGSSTLFTHGGVLNSSKPGGCVPVCKYNGRKRKSAGKSVEEKQKEFVIRKEELLRKSRGQQISNGSSRQQHEMENVESLGTLLIANEEGAMSVSSLQPIDEVYRPVTNLSVRGPFQPSSSTTSSTSRKMDKYSLSNSFSDFVAQKAARENGKESPANLNKEAIMAQRVGKENGIKRSSIKHTVTRRKVPQEQAVKENSFSEFVAQKAALESGKESPASLSEEDIMARPVAKENGTPRSSIEHTVTHRKVAQEEAGFGFRDESSATADDSFDSSTEEDDGDVEWVEVGVDEEDVGEDEEEVEAEYWEGDLPPMTPEEEEELLREAERELEELERRGDAGKDPDFDSGASEPSVDSKGAEMEQKLAELKNMVQKMEEQLAGDKGQIESSLSPPEENLEGLKNVAENFDGENGEEELDEDDEKELDTEEFEVLGGGHQQVVNGSDEIHIESKRVNLQYNRHQRQDYWELDGEEEEEEVKDERGVPAVMRCFDRAKVYVKAGDGGNGVVAFRREKFVPFGGPYGGNGGRGGQVYVEADSSMNSLLPFRKAVHFRAGRGSHGGGKRKEGAVGTDCTVKVPPGTLIREAGPEGKVLLELMKPGQREMLLPGGAGGRGNAAFKTGRNNAPQLAEFGEEGVEMWIELELKVVADVGIVGVPNAGKSTLLSAISAAKPEIANYPFTTLLPNVGVVALDYDATMVVADLPGLLEGAHTGIGLGHEFLRHTERCRVLVHVVDGMSLQTEEEFEAVRLELQLFNPILSEKPFVVAFNKTDIPEAAERWEAFQQRLRSKGVEPFCMSAATQQGTSEVIAAAYALLKEQKGSNLEDYTEEETKALAVGEMVRKQRSAPIENFTIEEDKHTRTWQVTGAGLERFTQMTNWEYFEAVRRFQRVLSASGVNKALRERGIKEGDTVIVAQMEFSWIDSEDMSALKDWKRGSRGSKVWPH